MGSFAHGDEHDVAYAHNAAQQRKDTYHPDGRAQDAHGALGTQVVGKAVPYPDSTVIGRVETVVDADGAAVFLLKGLVALDGGEVLGGKDDVVQLVALVVDGLQGRKGNVGFAGVAVALVVVGTHNLVGHSVGIDKLTDGVGVRFVEQDFG